MKRHFILLFLAVVFLIGCGGKPGVSDGKKGYQAELDKEYGKGAIVIEDVEKIKGEEKEIQGTKVYGMTVEVTLKSTKDVYKTEIIKPSFRDLRGGQRNVLVMRKGKTKKEKMTWVFEETEDGWKYRGK